MENYEHMVDAYYRGKADASTQFEKILAQEVTKARQEAYAQGFRDGQQCQADNVRRVLVDE